MPSKLCLIGERFDRLSVIAFSHTTRTGKSCWDCICDCGAAKKVISSLLRSGQTRSCGCLRRELAPNVGFKRGSGGHVTHGLSSRPEYHVWKGVVRRGTGKSDRRLYFDRGVRVCKAWRESFESFWEDMGPRPTSRHSVDRSDNNGNYSCGHCSECVGNSWPANCCWATPTEQRANQRQLTAIAFGGKSMTITAWAAEVGITQAGMSDRIKKWPLEKALTQPRRAQSLHHARKSRQPPREAVAA